MSQFPANASEGQRLAAVEAAVGGFNQRLDRMEAGQERIESKLDKAAKPDLQSWWAAAGVGVAVLGVIAAIGTLVISGFAGILYIGYQALTAENGAVESRSAMRNVEMKAVVADVKRDAADATTKQAADGRDERQRNDRVERDQGRMEGFLKAKFDYQW